MTFNQFYRQYGIAQNTIMKAIRSKDIREGEHFTIVSGLHKTRRYIIPGKEKEFLKILQDWKKSKKGEYYA